MFLQRLIFAHWSEARGLYISKLIPGVKYFYFTDFLIEAISSKNKCDTSFKIFDGRRRYNLKTKTLGNSFIENDKV